MKPIARLERQILSSGFKLIRQNKHKIFFDGITKLTLPAGTRISSRTEIWIGLQIKKAIELRQARGASGTDGATAV